MTRRLLVAAMALAMLAPTAAEARPGKVLPESWCSLSVHTPWIYTNGAGNTFIKAKATETCDSPLAGFKADFTVHLDLWKQEVNVDANPVHLRTIEVYCNGETVCRAVTQYDAVDSPSRLWLFWGEADALVEHGLGNDYDYGESSFLLYPPW